MKPSSKLTLKKKVKFLEGIPIFSRRFEAYVIIENEILYGYDTAEILDDSITIKAIDELTEDLFFEEFGLEAGNLSEKQVKELIFGKLLKGTDNFN
jgi:hypothetical protein